MQLATYASNQPRVPNQGRYRDLLLAFTLLSPPAMAAVAFGSAGGDIDLTDSAGNTLTQLIAIFIFANSIIIAKLYRISIAKIVLALFPLLVMSGWILLSAYWSEFSDLTRRRGAHEIIELASLSILGLSFSDGKSLIRALYWSFLLITLLNVFAIAVPSRSFATGAFGGISGNKNILGAFLFYALPILAIGVLDRSVSKSRIVAAVALLSGAGMLALSSSKSAVGCLLIAGCFAAATRLSLFRTVYSRVLVPIVLLLLSLSIWMIVADLGLSEAMTRVFGDATLTGRDQIWAYALSQHDTHPIGGVGYGALWQTGLEMQNILENARISWVANQSHDGYIDILAQLGWIGVVLIGIYLSVTFIRLLKYASRSTALPVSWAMNYSLYIFWGAIIYNVTESSFFRSGHPLWAIFLLVNGFVAGQVLGSGRRVRDSTLRGAATAAGHQERALARSPASAANG